MSDKAVELLEKLQKHEHLCQAIEDVTDEYDHALALIRECMKPGVCGSCGVKEGSRHRQECLVGLSPPAPELPCLPYNWEGPFIVTNYGECLRWNVEDVHDVRIAGQTESEAKALAAILNAAQKGS